jgi:DNA-binding CsgD family transcriptional regulator/GAF domain-containing protein
MPLAHAPCSWEAMTAISSDRSVSAEERHRLGAVEHLKTLCCLGLPPESAMVAVVPVLHEIIPHDGSRLALVAPDATITSGYSENPASAAIFRERLWRFMDDPTSLMSLWVPGVRAVALGWALHRQGGDYLHSGYYREIEAPLDSCWLLDAMIGDGGRTIGFVSLTRPRSTRRFTVDDLQLFDRLRPWLAHAFRRSPSDDSRQQDEAPIATSGASILSGQVVLTSEGRIVYQTSGVEQLLRILTGEPSNYTRYVPVSDRLPASVLKLLQQITGAANGSSNTPPRLQVSTGYGVLTLEAKWLVPAGTLPEDAARDPRACLIAVTIELREHPIAHAARVLRESGATAAQTKVGIQLALGKTRPEIADELGLQLSSVADHSKKLYQTLDVHNSTALGTKIWLNSHQDEARQGIFPAPFSRAGFVVGKPPYRSYPFTDKLPDEKAAAEMERYARRGGAGGEAASETSTGNGAA